MLKTTLPLIMTALALFIYPFAAKAAPEIGKTAPAFEAVDIDGNTVKLSDLKGKIVVLEWTNHQCPFVVKHYGSGNMQKTQKIAKEKGAEWITIVSSAEGRQGHTSDEEAREIIEDTGAHPDAKIMDVDGTIGKLYDAKTTPHMFVIDKDGMLAYAGAIDSNSSPNPETIEDAENYVLSAIEDLENDVEVRTKQSPPYGCSVKYAH